MNYVAPHRRRRWLVVGLVLAVAAVAGGWIISRDSSATPESLPEPSFSTSASVPVSPESSALPETDIPTIPPAIPTEVYIPSTDTDLVISAPVYPMPTDCRQVIDPPRDGAGIGDIYTCQDLDLPGTSSAGLAILAGHSSSGFDAQFNKLYVRGDELEGIEVMVRTETSGDTWLVYQVQAVHEPLKTDLPYMAEVWGAPGESTSGRLILVTCLQNSDGSASTHNYIVVAQLVGVRS